MPLNDLLKHIKDSYDIFYKKKGPRVDYIMLVKLQCYFSTDAVHVPPPLDKIHLNTEQV